MVINKYLSGTTPVSLALSNFAPSGAAQLYQLTSANAITRLADLTPSGNTASFTAPAQSITLLVFPAGAANTPPVASASASPSSGTAPLNVAFSSAGSNDPDGSISAYSWSFGDGSAASSSPSPAHIYQTAGTYTAVLTVTDNRGATATAQTSVVVSANPNTLNAPSGLTASSGRTVVTLNWLDNSTNETGFYIERAPSGSSSFTRIGTTGANVKTYSDAAARGTWLYRVQAFNATTTSAYSNTVTVRVK